jgi:hypothetical protein
VDKIEIASFERSYSPSRTILPLFNINCQNKKGECFLMALVNGFIPYPSEFIERVLDGNLSKPELNVLHVISKEILGWKNTRETMEKELSLRYIGNRLNMHPSNVAKAENKLERKGFITIVYKGKGSAPSIIRLNCIVQDTTLNINSAVQNTTVNACSVVQKTTNQRILSKEKDHQESDMTDDILNIDNEEKNAIEEKTIETPLNCKSTIEGKQVSPKVSNTNKPAINLPRQANFAAPSTVKSEFSALGSVISGLPVAPPVVSDIYNTYSSSDTNTLLISSKGLDKNYTPVKDTYTTLTLSDKSLAKGKEILHNKNFNSQETTAIIDRITGAMASKDIKSKEKYFIAACNKETKKSNNNASSLHKSTSAALPIKPVKRPDCLSWKEDLCAKEIIEKLSKVCPEKLYTVIMSVENNEKTQKGLALMPEGIMKNMAIENIVLSEFKKRFPEIIV